MSTDESILSQGQIDALLAKVRAGESIDDLDSEEDGAEASAPDMDQDAPGGEPEEDAPEPAAIEARTAEGEEDGDGQLGQGDIDAVDAAMDQTDAAPEVPGADDGAGQLGQGDIDALFA
ncbi:MAG: hypothetical protein GY859_06840, partial [Desulfobacterales bacterium]|nr:hypothetical protein [Desulfobacterales bacterium]